MASDKKKGDFDKSRKHDIGGDKKQQAQDSRSPSRTASKQNAGGGGRR